MKYQHRAMRRHLVALAVIAVAALVTSVAAQPGADAERFWHQWRGPHATGASRTANPPTEWSETRNIRWKVEIPGRGSGSPVVWGDGMVFAMSGFQGSRLRAIRLADAKGDITGGNAIVWTLDRDTPYVPSPLLYEGLLYVLKSNSGILSVFAAKTGRPHYQLQRLAGIPEVYSSPVAAQNRVYLTGRDGTTLVIRHGASFEVLATNTLDDGFDASAALVDDHIYLRGYRNLYDIAVTH